jgi:hypothetical protein
MTLTEIQSTEPMAGSVRMPISTDRPWWSVRLPLAATLAASIALLTAVSSFAGLPPAISWPSARSIGVFLEMLGATPSLAAIGLMAAALASHHPQRRSARVLCSLLALAAFGGALARTERDAKGSSAFEQWFASAVLEDRQN